MADDAPAEAGTDNSAGPGNGTARLASGELGDAAGSSGTSDGAAVPALGTAAAAVSAAPADPGGSATGTHAVRAPASSHPIEGAAAGGGADGQAADAAEAGSATAAASVADHHADAATVSAESTHTVAVGGVDGSAAGTADGDTEAKDATRRGKGGFWRELPVLVVIAVALAVLIRTFLVQAFFIPSGSMEKTLHGCPGCSGDKVLVNKLVYHFRDPRPGDIVVFRGPPSWESEVQVEEPGNPISRAVRWIGQTVGVAQPDEKDFVKRVIAVGGQTVACCDPQGRVTVDGVPLDEPYIYLTAPGVRPQEFGPVTVPKGRLWVMGDHRDGSADSRAHIDDGASGTVPVDDVIGKAFVIVWPPSRWATLGTPETFHNLSSGPLLDGVPIGMGLVAALPVVGLRRRRAKRRVRSDRAARSEPSKSSKRREPRPCRLGRGRG